MMIILTARVLSFSMENEKEIVGFQSHVKYIFFMLTKNGKNETPSLLWKHQEHSSHSVKQRFIDIYINECGVCVCCSSSPRRSVNKLTSHKQFPCT